jgi:hypothetical protein
MILNSKIKIKLSFFLLFKTIIFIVLYYIIKLDIISFILMLYLVIRMIQLAQKLLKIFSALVMFRLGKIQKAMIWRWWDMIWRILQEWMTL